VDIQVIRRTGREGFKAGALAAGLAAARGDYIAYFDADFEPPADFLRRTIPHFADPRIAFVQARWGHLNHRYSVLTLLQSLLLDAHFMIEQFARSRGGYAFNFNGTAGVWRRVAIEAAGGWRFDTLTEDIDLSYRAFIGGWKAMYLRDLVCPAELPVTMTGFLRQQHRWAQGGLECSLKLLPQIWKARFGWGSKVQATYHLTGLYLHFAMFALILAYPVIILVSQRFPELTRLYGLGALWSVPSAVWPLFLALAQQQMGERWMRRVPAIAVTGALGSTMMLVTLRAAWRLVRGGQRVFERTPKFGIARPQDSWSGRRYHLPFASPLLLEILVALWALATTVYALSTRAWVLAVLPGFLFVGALLVVVLTLKQSTTAGAAPRPTASA
jgi:cellulose synthase/poly-beta-1,6-N-acetylglucosamine synthase-like glycosyltransferase